MPEARELGPSLCGGLTLLHYDSFAACASLPALRRRLSTELPFHINNGIHVLVSQTAQRELTIGDSHEYGQTLEPFDREAINAAILAYLDRFLALPAGPISERWHGVYAKVPGGTELVLRPADGVEVVTALGGAGMTMAFGLAEEVVSGVYPNQR